MNLKRDCLAQTLLPPDHIEGMARAAKDMSREKLIECLRRLCGSHERLRAELECCEELLVRDGIRLDAALEDAACWRKFACKVSEWMSNESLEPVQITNRIQDEIDKQSCLIR